LKGNKAMHKIFHMLKFFVLLIISAAFFTFAHDQFGRYLFGAVGMLSVVFILAEMAGYGELRNQ